MATVMVIDIPLLLLDDVTYKFPEDSVMVPFPMQEHQRPDQLGRRDPNCRPLTSTRDVKSIRCLLDQRRILSDLGPRERQRDLYDTRLLRSTF